MQNHYVNDIGRDLAAWARFPDIERHLAELDADRPLLAHIERVVADVPEFRTKRWSDAFRQLGTYRAVLYALVRCIRPRLAVETGVLHGLTSLVLLAALDRNATGKLLSIDLPSYAETGPSNRDGHMDTLPRGRQPGWIVDGPYRDRWDLRLGRSLDVLPAALDELGPLDFFLHDSEHTYDTMTGEMRLAWDHLQDGGMLVCDNIGDSAAFADFCRAIDRTPFLVPHEPGDPPRFGVVRR